MTAQIEIAPLKSEFLIALARECGADDAGIALLGDPALDEERSHIARAFPAAKILLSLIGRMHREPVRSPARSIANLEFHHAGDALDQTARGIVRELEDRGVPALNPAMAFPMEMDDFPQRGWVVSHKRVAETAGMGKMGIHRNLIHPKYGSFVSRPAVERGGRGEGGGIRRDRGGGARDEGRPGHDWTRPEGLARPRFVDGRGATQRRRPSSFEDEGPDASR